MKLRAAERSLARAQDYTDDGESAKAVTALAATNRNLRSALKAVKRRTVAGDDTGSESAYAFAAVADDVIAVAAIAALSDANRAGYARTLRRIAADAKSEASDIADAKSDDTLTDAAKAALDAAATQFAATATKAGELVVADSSSSGSSDSSTAGSGSGSADDRGDCPGHGADDAAPALSAQ